MCCNGTSGLIKVQGNFVFNLQGMISVEATPTLEQRDSGNLMVCHPGNANLENPEFHFRDPGGSFGIKSKAIFFDFDAV